MEMKYKTDENFERVKAIQTAIEDVYQFDPATESLIIVGKIDNLQKTNSNLDCSLKVILDKYLNTGVLDLGGLAINQESYYSLDVNDFKKYELNDLASIVNKANEYRLKYNLDLTMSVNDVFKYVNDLSNKMNVHVNELQKNKDKEVKKIEKKDIIEEEEQDGLQDESKQN